MAAVQLPFGQQAIVIQHPDATLFFFSNLPKSTVLTVQQLCTLIKTKHRTQNVQQKVVYIAILLSIINVPGLQYGLPAKFTTENPAKHVLNSHSCRP